MVVTTRHGSNGGLAFATVLTLIITPCMLALSARRAEKKSTRRDKSANLGTEAINNA